MASIRDISKYEGLAINRALFFDVSDYVYWKTRMMVYILMKTIDGKEVLTPKAEWTAHDKEMVKYNTKAMHILFCALSKTQFNKV